MRAAIYFTPGADAPLTKAAAEWLGRCAFRHRGNFGNTAHPLVASPARYGFHATMKAPFRLAKTTDIAMLDAELARFCATRAPVTIPRLSLGLLGAFFALVPDVVPAGLAELERAIVMGFNRFRAPLTEAEIARRSPERLTPRQRHHLERWGYPHVLEDFRFHMTLTAAVEPEQQPQIRILLEKHFEYFDGQPLTVDRLALFVEPAPEAPFLVHSIHPFGQQVAARKELP